MRKTCTQCQSAFEITDADLAFYDKVSPVFGNKKYLIPPPTLCPDCRQQRRWAFQNQRFLYRRKCSLSGQDIISAYSAEKPLTVLCKEDWLKTDNTDTGREFDFKKPFFEQFGDLFRSTPKAYALQTGEMINSDYTHFAGWQKNCYLIFDAGNCEDCMYGTFMGYCKSCMDVLDLQRNELCYDCVDLSDCYGLMHCTFCRNCSSSAYLFDCIGCKHCIGCVNLRNKEYCIFNKEVGKQEFEKTWKALFKGSFGTQEAMKKRWEEFAVTCPRRAVHNVNAKDCSGDYLVNCENATDCYKCIELRDSKYCQYSALKSNDIWDGSSCGESMSFCYEISASWGTVGQVGISNCCFDAFVFYGGNNVYYSIHCTENCKDLFGCSDLRGKKYCIFNKQYSQKEYETLVPKIIDHMKKTGEWGEFFPVTLSPFGYNESVAQDYFPLNKEETIENGWQWKDRDAKEYLPATFKLPSALKDTPDTIIKETLACTQCTKNYRIAAKELEYYQTHGLPIPRLCPDCRYLVRIARRNPQKLWDRACGKCNKPIKTSYSPERPEIVYCESCYLETVY